MAANLVEPDTPLSHVCDLPVRWPKATLAILLTIACITGTGLFRISFDPSTEKVFPDGHPAVLTYQSFRDTFGGDEAIFISVHAPVGDRDVFTPRTLGLCRDLARELVAEIDGVEQAFSLAGVPFLRFNPLNPLAGPTLAPGLPDDLDQVTPEALELWRDEVLETPFVDRNLVSRDRRATMVVVILDSARVRGAAGAIENKRICFEIKSRVHAIKVKGWDTHLVGSPIIKAEIMEAIRLDMITFTAPLVLVALLAAAMLLRSWRGMFLVAGVLVVSVELTLGTIGLLGMPLDSMTSLIPPLILVIGVADSLHLLVEQQAVAARLGPVADGPTTTREALRHIFVPCLLTSVTTSIGFASLLVSDIPPIRRFGAAAAISALVAFAVTMMLIPAACSLLSSPRPLSRKAVRADRLADAVVRYPRLSLCASVAIFLTAAAGFFLVEADTNFIAYFPKESRIRRDSRAMLEAGFNGIAPVEMIVVGAPGDARRPEVIAAVYAFERALEKESPIVDQALSAVDIVHASLGVIEGTPRLPSSEEEVRRLEALLLRLSTGQLPMERLISPPTHPNHPGEEWIRVSVRANRSSSRQMTSLIEVAERLEKEHLIPAGLTVIPTGTSIVFGKTANVIMKGQIESFLWAFISITVILAIALRSIRLGLLSILPNIFPIAILVGTMGYLGIALDSFNSMVASIAIGIAVDDTIHVLSGFKRFSRVLPHRAAVRETIAHEGAALRATSTVLFLGFACLLLATFQPTKQFGFLTSVCIVAALFGDLVILPAILLIVPWPGPDHPGESPDGPAAAL